MKRKKAGNIFSILQRVLFLVLAILIVVIAGVTLWAFAAGKVTPGVGLRRADPEPRSVPGVAEGTELIFSDIGQLRAVTADDPPIPVIITPFFPYPSDDVPFQEELTAKTRGFRSVIRDYFARSTRAELLERGETQIKSDILELINAELALGSVKTLYFSEYMFFE